jgi:hypothetical protein
LDKQFSYLVLALTNSQSTKYYIILRHALRDKPVLFHFKHLSRQLVTVCRYKNISLFPSSVIFFILWALPAASRWTSTPGCWASNSASSSWKGSPKPPEWKTFRTAPPPAEAFPEMFEGLLAEMFIGLFSIGPELLFAALLPTSQTGKYSQDRENCY